MGFYPWTEKFHMPCCVEKQNKTKQKQHHVSNFLIDLGILGAGFISCYLLPKLAKNPGLGRVLNYYLLGWQEDKQGEWVRQLCWNQAAGPSGLSPLLSSVFFCLGFFQRQALPVVLDGLWQHSLTHSTSFNFTTSPPSQKGCTLFFPIVQKSLGMRTH